MRNRQMILACLFIFVMGTVLPSHASKLESLRTSNLDRRALFLNLCLLMNELGFSDGCMELLRIWQDLSPEDTMTPTPIGTPVEPTPTPGVTPVESTPTPTPTIPETGNAAVLALTCCEPGYVGSAISVRIDQLDSSGGIVNPGLEDGDIGRLVTVHVDGPARFWDGTTTTETLLDQPMGTAVTVIGDEPGEVIITAEAPGVAEAEPLICTFLPAGSVSGTIRIWNEGMGSFQPPVFEMIIFSFYESGTSEIVTTGHFMGFENPMGQYSMNGIPPGTYDVQFEIAPMMDIDRHAVVCVSGVVVNEMEETQGVNADIPLRTGGDLTGIAYVLGQGSFRYGSVMAIPEQGTSCLNSQYSAMFGHEEEVSEAEYFLGALPAGNYQIIASAGGDSGQYELVTQETVTITEGELRELDILLSPVVPITPLSPVNNQRVTFPLVFQWSIPEDAPEMIFTVFVLDRCGNKIWSQHDIQETEVQYTGEGLSRSEIYTWHVSGFAVDGSATGHGNSEAGWPSFALR